MILTLKDGEKEWALGAECRHIPRVGETVWLAQAPKGIVHIVRSVQHRFDGCQHIVVLLDRLVDPDAA